VARVDPSAPVKPGERCAFAINASGMQFFPPTSAVPVELADPRG